MYARKYKITYVNEKLEPVCVIAVSTDIIAAIYDVKKEREDLFKITEIKEVEIVDAPEGTYELFKPNVSDF